MSGERGGRGGGGSIRAGEVAMEWERGLAQGPTVARCYQKKSFEWVMELEGIIEDAVVFIDRSM